MILKSNYRAVMTGVVLMKMSQDQVQTRQKSAASLRRPTHDCPAIVRREILAMQTRNSKS
jgi:hypothetical protein